MKREEIYDFLCDTLDGYMKIFNPCEIHQKDEKAVCLSELDECCADCKYLGSNGCTTSCLGCKLYICFSLQKKDPVFKELVNVLKVIAKKYNLIAMRTPKEKLFRNEDKQWNSQKYY